MLIIDKLSYQSRWCQSDPRRKFGLYLVLLVIALSSQPLVQIAEFIGTALLTCYLLRIRVQRYLQWLAIPLFFLLVGLLGILISFSYQPASMLWSLQINGLAIGIDPVGLQVAHHTLWRSLAALSATYLFILTTPFNQLIRLLQMSRLPHVLIEHMLLTYRFIFILIEEASAIRQAQSLRFGYCSLRCSYRSMAMLVGLLLQRVIYRYQQMETTLDVKLFQGEFHL